MALPPLASLTDLLDSLGLAEFESDLDAVRAERALALASALVRAEVGLTWATGGVLDADIPDIAFEVTLAAAERRWRNPEGEQAETIGPFSYRSGGGGQSSVGIFLTDDERRMLKTIRGTGQVNVLQFSSPWALGRNTGYVPVDIGGDDFPLFAE